MAASENTYATGQGSGLIVQQEGQPQQVLAKFLNLMLNYQCGLTITATQELGEERISRTATVDIYITGSLNEARIEPALGTVSMGKTVHFTAVGRDENGLTLPGLVVRWEVTDPSVGTIDPVGNFTAGNAIGYHKNAIVATVIQPLTD